LTKAERDAKKAERKALRAAKKEEMKMLRDLQSVQGNALLEEMKSGGKKTAVAEQSYGETYLKTTVMDAEKIDEQMSTTADGEKKMQIGKGASATEKPDDAVAKEPAASTTTTKPASGTTTGSTTGSTTTTKPASGTTTGSTTAPKTRLLQDAKATAANSTAANTNATKSTDWKKLKKDEDFMKVVINKKMFEKGGPLFGIKKPIIMFNKHGADYVKEFPRGKKGDFDPKTGKKLNKTAVAAAAKAVNASEAVVDENDDQLEDTNATQVLELEFVDGDTMENIKVSNLTKGMLKVCMIMKDKKSKLQYVNEENEQFQDDGISQASMTERKT